MECAECPKCGKEIDWLDEIFADELRRTEITCEYYEKDVECTECETTFTVKACLGWSAEFSLKEADKQEK